MVRIADAASVPGLPESRLSPADLTALPPTVPGAPWTCRVRAVAWMQRARPPAFAWEAGHVLPLALVAVVDYLDTPVGPYREVLAATALRRGARLAGQVPFIAVDSPASARGGRVNWALPKTIATFDGDAGRGDVAITGVNWRITVDAGRRGPAVPLRLAFSATGPLGDTTTRLRAVGRPVLVRAAVHGPTLGGWLGGGRHAGVALEGQVTVEAPQPASGQG